MASCDKWAGPKVSWKFIDTPGYYMRCALKSNVSVFSTYLFRDVSLTACARTIDANYQQSTSYRVKHTLQ